MTSDASAPASPLHGRDGNRELDRTTSTHLPTARRTHRRRRPSGAPPPLPRSLGSSGKGWLVAMGLLLVWVVVAYWSRPVRRATDAADAAVLRTVVRGRTAWLTDVAERIDRIGSGWTITIVSAGLLLSLVAFRRWRHLFTFLGSLAALESVGSFLYERFERPRPYDVTIIGRWAGFSLPSPPVAILAIVIVGILYSMIVAGHPRNVAKIVGAILVLLHAAARLYLGVDHPFDILVGLALAVAIPLNAFRFFVPNDIFPVVYRRGKTAHLDVTGRRGEAIRRAVQDQLGVTVVDIAPVGLAGSGGSTPLRIRVAGDPDSHLFGKLYAMNHVRADRWYKLGRTILYGRLEDEAPFQSVRRLVQYEDYTLRLMRDVGVPTAMPFGIVELTPEREYLLVTEFFEGATEIGETEVDDALIDEGLALVRRLWDAGVAHRDIKPANLMVQDGHLKVIDVAFAQVRPSPWREAVDLANMMLVLAVRTDADRVYERALAYFTPDEIAEAFAAARGIASPSQLRAAMKHDGRDLLARFRALAPTRPPISLQRWGVRRLALIVAAVLIVQFLVTNTAGMLAPVHDLEIVGTPACGTENLMILASQSVPSATSVPCVSFLPGGWAMGELHIRRGRFRFWLESDSAADRDDEADHSVRVTLLAAGRCAVGDATEVPSDQVGMRRYERPERLPPDLRTERVYVFDGGCVEYRYQLGGDASASTIFEVDRALSFQPREELVAEVRERSGLRLCGAGAPACVGR